MSSTPKRLLARVKRSLATERDGEPAPASIAASDADVAALRNAVGCYEPGHYYSALPTFDEAISASRRPPTDELPGIDLRTDAQLRLAAELGAVVADQPFVADADEARARGLRYHFANGFFGTDDGLVLHGLLRLLRPAQVIEVGSGWSSANMLDTDERFLDGRTRFTFIDPEPMRLDSLLRPDDESSGRVTVHRKRVQDVDPALFATLQPGDVLFIDSSHVTKAGSDVNLLLLDVIPSLPAGVHVHIHDVPWPFEYGEAWAREGRFWNEAYLVRALLTDNPRLQIRWFNSYLARTRPDEVRALVPGYLTDGLSLWLDRIEPVPAPSA